MDTDASLRIPAEDLADANDPMLPFINKWLHKFGVWHDGRAKFRVALSNQTEHRWGEYAEFYGGNIFLRTTVGVLEVPKYSWLPELHWVLEELKFPAYDQSRPLLPELVDSYSGVYESRYTFARVTKYGTAAKMGEPGKLELPTLRAIQFIMEAILETSRMKKSDWEDIEKGQEMEEYWAFRTLFEEERPLDGIGLYTANGEGIVLNKDPWDVLKKKSSLIIEAA